MSKVNPYAATEVSVDQPVVDLDNGASRIWYAGTVVVLSAAVCSLIFVLFRGLYDPVEQLLLGTLLPTSLYTVGAVMIYALAGKLIHVYSGKNWHPTVTSNVIAGAMSSAYIAVTQLAWFLMDGMAVLVGSLVLAVPCAFVVSLVERSTAGETQRPVVNRAPELARVTQASVFWFCTACLLIGTVAGAWMQPDGGLYYRLVGGITSGAIFCLILTILYGLASLAVRRAHRATVASRVWAGITFASLAGVLGYALQELNFPAGLPRIGIIALVTPLAVGVDRWVAGRVRTQ